ncbi:MAG: Sec-independent protein translocase protein TatB [Pseudomonadota bacterium]
MLDIGGWELLMIGVIALIVVGPKDLPVLVRNVGRWVGKARSLAREFQSGMEAAAQDVKIDELREVTSAKSDLERSVRDIGRRAQNMMDGLDGAPEGTAKPKPAAAPKRSASTPAPSRPASAGGDRRVEPSFDGRAPSDSFSAHDDGPDDALDRFQAGMRRRN